MSSKKVLDEDSLVAIKEYIDEQDESSISQAVEEAVEEATSTSFIYDPTIRIKNIDLYDNNEDVMLKVDSYPISKYVYDMINNTERVVLRLPWLRQTRSHQGRSKKRFSLPDNWKFITAKEKQQVDDVSGGENTIYTSDLSEDELDELKDLFVKYHWITITPEMLKQDSFGNYFIHLETDLWVRTQNQLLETVSELPDYSFSKTSGAISVWSKDFISNRYRNSYIYWTKRWTDDKLYLSYSDVRSFVKKWKYNYTYKASTSSPVFYIPDEDDDGNNQAFLQLKQRYIYNFRPEFCFSNYSPDSVHRFISTSAWDGYALANLTITQMQNLIADLKDTYDYIGVAWIENGYVDLMKYKLYYYYYPSSANNHEGDLYYGRLGRTKKSITNGHNRPNRELIRPNFAILAEDWSDWDCKHIWQHKSPMADRIITIKWEEHYAIRSTTTNIISQIGYDIQDII